VKASSDGNTATPSAGLDAGHEFLVLALRVVDQRDGRPHQRRQLRDLAGVVHAELDDAGAVRFAQAQQGQRHADVVVQVALGREGSIAVSGAQDRRDHLRDGGLAVAAGHRHQRQRETRAPGRGQLLQRAQRVGHLQARQPVAESAFGECSYRTGGPGGAEVVVAVEAFAAQCDEEIAGAQRAGVAVHALEGGRAAADQLRAGQQRLGLAQRHHAPTPCRRASAARASAWSENGNRTPATSW
jgi:hypothetical protein